MLWTCQKDGQEFASRMIETPVRFNRKMIYFGELRLQDERTDGAGTADDYTISDLPLTLGEDKQ